MNRNRLRFSQIFLILFVLSLIPLSSQFAYSASFSDITNLSNDANDSEFPSVFSVGDNVYVVWFDDTDNEIRFTNSTNSGTSFWAHEKIGDTATGGTEATSPDPQVVANGDNVFVVWQDNDKIKFDRSTNNGNTFSGTIKTLDDAAPTSNPSLNLINSTSDDVYVSWFNDADADKVLYINSTDNGATFNDPDGDSTLDSITLGNTGGASSTTVQKTVTMAASGNNVYVVWPENSGLKFVRSTDNGDTFESVQIISTFNTFTDIVNPDIAVDGNSVYLVWRDITGVTGSDQVKVNFIKNTNGGATGSWSSITDVGNGLLALSSTLSPKVAKGSNDHVFVAWNDDTAGVKDIKLARSSNDGDSFDTDGDSDLDADDLTNLSDTAGTISQDLQLTTFNDNVSVVWRENTADGNDKDIRATISVNNGTNFISPRDISALTGGTAGDFATLPALSGTGSNSFIVWEESDTSSSNDGDIKFAIMTASAPVTFVETNYKLSETATIRITDSDLNTNAGSKQQYDVTVKSETDSITGITVTLEETTNTSGIFEGTLTFSSNASTGTVLKASAGDTITATFGTSSGTTTIHTRTVAFHTNDYFVGDAARVIVTDKNSDTDDTGSTDSITVDLSVRDSGFTTTVTLQETATSGTFGTTTDHDIIIMNKDLRIPLDRYMISTEVRSGNSPDVNEIDQRTETISTPTSGTDLTLTLDETAINSNEFSNNFKFYSGATSNALRVLQSTVCDIFQITFAGESNDRGLITPCNDATKIPLIVDVPTTSDSDQITATYLGATDSETIYYDSAKTGGGGGGLVRPSIVLNAVAAAAIFSDASGGGSDRSPPITSLDVIVKSKQFDIPDHIKKIVEQHDPNVPIEALEGESYDLPLTINEKQYPLGSSENTIKTDHLEVGEPIKLKMLFYEQRDLEHVSLYMNIRGDQRSDQSDTYIEFNKDKPMKIIDKNGFFENIKFEIIEGEDNKKYAIFDITFAKSMDTSDLVYKTWDIDRRGTAIKVHDAIKVDMTSDIIPDEKIMDVENIPNVIDLPAKEKPPVPAWVKSNAKWWADGGINDDTFTNGIAYLISEQIIDIPIEENISPERDEDGEIIEKEIVDTKMPEWIKTNAQWWSDDLMDEETFLSGIEYMVKNNYIIIP